MSKKPTKAAAEPRLTPKPYGKPPREPEDELYFQRGRHARRGGIKREDSPYLEPAAKVWRAGWDFEDEAQGG